MSLYNLTTYKLLVVPSPDDPDGIGSLSPCYPTRPKVISSSSSGNISTPMWPYRYPNDMECEWHIIADRKKAINITLLRFTLDTIG